MCDEAVRWNPGGGDDDQFVVNGSSYGVTLLGGAGDGSAQARDATRPDVETVLGLAAAATRYGESFDEPAGSRAGALTGSSLQVEVQWSTPTGGYTISALKIAWAPPPRPSPRTRLCPPSPELLAAAAARGRAAASRMTRRLHREAVAVGMPRRRHR